MSSRGGFRFALALAAFVVVAIGAPAVADGPEDSVGVVDQGTGLWYLRDPFTGETTSFYYGNPGDFPVMGDWDCDGDDNPGLYRQSDGFVYLRHSNTQGNAHIRFFFGNPGDIPLAGDFDGDGCDTISIYRPSQGRVFIINELGTSNDGLGEADLDFYFGNPGDKPFVGDFDDDGDDTIGLHRESTGLVYFRNDLSQGNAESQFIFGNPGDKIIAGEWAQKGDFGPATVGIFRPAAGTFYLRFSNAQGNADAEFLYGNDRMLPVAGDFGPLPGGDPPPPGPILGQAATVTNIVDGDTIDARINGIVSRIRLIGIDTPEVGECFYGEAANRLSALINGKNVTLVKDVSETDRFGRLLRYIYLGAQHINRTMVREGYAVAAEFPPDTAKATEFAAAEAAAKSELAGLWGDCGDPGPGPGCDPSYPTVCIPPPPPDLDCGEIPHRNFTVIGADPHRFDGNNNGIGCET